MSVDHSSGAKPPTKDPLFLHVKAGMTVVVLEGEDSWMGDVIYEQGAAMNPKVPPLFQIACFDAGVIRWVNADLVANLVSAT